MQVVTFASTKGGVGKSTMAGLTVDSLLRNGNSVRVMDLDPQGNLRTWSEAVQKSENKLIISESALGDDSTFHELYDELVEIFEEETDWVIIDTAGQDHFRQHPALAISDLVICPSGPVKNELLGVRKTVEYLSIALKHVDPDLDPLDYIRILYQEPNGFPNASMLTMREVLYEHFGVVDKMHRSSAITSFLGDELTTSQAIALLQEQGKSTGAMKKIQTAADRFTQSLKEQFDA